MPDLAQYDIIHQFFATLHQPWLTWFSDTLPKWRELDDATRKLANTIVDQWLTTLAPNALPADLEHETLCVQLFNIAGRRGQDAITFIRKLSEIPPPRLEGGWRSGLHFSAPKDSPNAIWESPMLGLIGAPNWSLISMAWSNLTPDFRDFLVKAVTAELMPPESMSTPQAIAWLDRMRRKKSAPAQDVLKSYQRLSHTDASAIADLLLNQHIAWRSAGIIPTSGGVHKADHYVPYALCRLACLSGPLDPELLDKASSAQIEFPDPILTKVEVIRRKRLCLEQGVALKEIKPEEAEKRLTSSPPAVRAGHAELFYVRGARNPLFVLLDADLTRAELAFLKLKGTRLRICDWAKHSDSPCSTRIDLDGGVELLGEDQPPEVDKSFRGPFVNFVDERPLVTPFEGTREACSLGAQFRIGGVPSWEQEPEIPRSPIDSKPMTFLAQFPHPNGGTAYLFLDFRNLIATVITQWD